LRGQSVAGLVRATTKKFHSALAQRGFKKLKERGIHAASRSKFMET